MFWQYPCSSCLRRTSAGGTIGGSRLEGEAVAEEQWLKSTDSDPMLKHLGPNADHRLYRLFACACVRRIWHLLEDRRSKKAVEVAEEFAEGRVSNEQLRKAAEKGWLTLKVGSANGSFKSVRFSVGTCAESAYQAARVVAANSAWAAGGGMERLAQAELLRCLFGNPFLPKPELPVSVRVWHGGAILKLASAIYQERAFDRLPVLADMLEEAGCTDTAVLGHCRGPGPHARGCHVLDLILRPRDPTAAERATGGEAAF
jgi:hypothetical protein